MQALHHAVQHAARRTVPGLLCVGLLGAAPAGAGAQAAAVAPAVSASDAAAALQLQRWMRAAELDSPQGLREQLRLGADPNLSDAQGQTALHWALLHGSEQAVDFLLALPGLRVDPRNQAGETPLMLAALRNRLDWVQALVARGAVWNSPAAAKAWTPLHYAATAPGTEVLRWLLDRPGLDLNPASTNGSTPLMMALGYGGVDAAVLLLKAGADHTRRNDLGLDAFDFARRAGREDVVARLGLVLRPKP